MNARTFIRAAALAVFASFSIAASANPPKQAVAVLPLDDSSTREAIIIDRLVSQWVESASLVEFFDLDEYANPRRAADTERRIAQGVYFRDSALDAYDMMSYEQALMRIERAIEAFELVDLRKHLNKLLDAYFIRGLALFYEGNPTLARNQFRDIFSIRRDYRPDRTRVTPDVEALIEEARRFVLDSPPSSLEIQTHPVQAGVYLNGSYRGVSPIEIVDLAPGSHYVTVEAPGYSISQELHRAAPGQVARIRLEDTAESRELRPLVEALRFSLIERKPSSNALTITRWSGADRLLVVGVETSNERTRLAAYIYESDSHLLAYTETTIPTASIEAGFELSRFLDNLHLETRARGPNGEPQPDPPARFSLGLGSSVSLDLGRINLGYAISASGAALLVSAVLTGRSASSSVAEAVSIPQLDVEEYDAAMLVARRKALIADCLYVGAGAGLTYGLYLMIRDRSSPKPQDRSDDPKMVMRLEPIFDGFTISLASRF